MRRFTFNSFGDTTWLATLTLAVVIAAVCVMLLYRYERRLVHRRLGITLLSLRLAVIAVVFVTLLEPVLTWTIDRSRTGRVLIALDVSDSMATADSQADRAEQLRWLRALNMIGNEQIAARLDRWQESLNAGQEPQWVDDDESQDPVERAALESARRDQLNELMRAVEQLTRKEIAFRLINNGPDALRKSIETLAIPELQVFAGTSLPTDAAELARTVANPGEFLPTDVSDLLTGMTPAVSADEPLAGIVLFTDGRENAAVDSQQLLRRVRGLTVPVYPVLIGSEQRPRDLAIGELEYPAMIYQNDTALLKAQVRTPGFDGDDVTVTLDLIDHPEQTQSRTVTAADRTLDLEFPLAAADLGRHQYVLRIETKSGETRDDNNEKRFSVNVVDDESHVLILEGQARWEFRFLDNALTRDERVQVERVVFQQPFLGVLPDTFFPRTLVTAEGADPSTTPFAEFDAVIVGDVSREQCSEQTLALLERFVKEEGGTLVLTAGRSHFAEFLQSDTIRRLLPIEQPHPVSAPGNRETDPPAARGFHLTLTPEGLRQEFLQFDIERQENVRIWRSLPGHPWGLVANAKPESTVFAFQTDEDGNTGLDFERSHALIAHQNFGAGQVLWIGIDSTWRWRHRVGDQYHHRFWGQVARWASKFKASAGNEKVRFGPQIAEIESGEDALLRAVWNQQFLSQSPDLVARAIIYDATDPDSDRPVRSVDLTPTANRPQIHEATVSGLDAGEYRIELQVDNADLGEDPVTAELIVNERATRELADLSADRALLEQIAEATGGRLYLPDEVREIPELFAGVTEHEQSQREVPLWDHWLVLALCFGLLTAEWVLRKLNGLP